MATAEEIRGWFAANPGASDAQIAAAMQANNVSSGEVAAAMGVDPGMVAQRYAAATAPAATPPPAAAAPVSPQDWQLGVSGGLLNARRAGQTDAQYYGAVALAANKYLGNPGTAAEAFDAMSKAGISVSDLLNAGISQQAIDAALTLPTNPVQLLTNTAALNSMTSTLAQNPLMAAEIGRTGLETIYKNAREYVGALQQGGLTDAERNKLREAAAGQGWSYADIRAAGLDPMLLFGTPKPVVPPPPPPPPPQPPVVVDRFPNTQTPYTTVNVYQPLPTQPDLYAPGQPALDTAFRESAPRTAIPGMPGAYEYTPAAKLRPATGAGYSWTPPVVTSRPRSLLSPTLLSYVSPSQQFAQSRAAQDQALLSAFRQSGLPQSASNFYSWRNRLRSGEFGAGSAFDPTAFQSAFGSWAATQAPRTPAQGTAPVGDVTGYSEIAGRIQPIDLRTVPTFAEGGEASARELLDRLKKPEGAEADVPGAVGQGPRNLPLERMNVRRARAGMGPFVPQAPTGTAGQEAADMLAALSLATAPLPVASDISGLAADAAMYAAYPEERTLGNAALSVLGALPFVPSASAVRAGEKAADAIQQAPTEARQMLDTVPQGATPRVPAVGTPVSFVNLRRAGASRDELRQVERDFKGYQSGVQSVDELVSTATRVDPVFQGSVRDVADTIGGTYIPGPPKTAESVIKKLTRKGGTAADVADSIRATVLVENNAQAEEAVRQIASRYPTIDEGWQRIPSNGYIDRKLGVQFTGPNGERLLGEIQINTLPMQTAKDKEGHKLYKIEQSLIEKYGAPEKMPDEELMRYRDAVQEQSRIYGEAETRVDSSILEQLVEKRARGGYIGRLGRP